MIETCATRGCPRGAQLLASPRNPWRESGQCLIGGVVTAAPSPRPHLKKEARDALT
jgi:hypothetical protein